MSYLQNRAWRPKSIPSQTCGMVVVIALFMVALIALLSTLMMTQVMRHTERTALLQQAIQARFEAEGGVAWAIDVLNTDWDKQKPHQPIDRLPLSSPVQWMNGYRLQTTIKDAQGLFNLNTVTAGDESAKKGLMQLLGFVDPNLSTTTKQTIVNALADWIQAVKGEGRFDADYLSQNPPYRAAHRPLAMASELLFVKGMTPDLYQKLKPYVVALPILTPINIATASAPVMMTLSPGLSVATATELVNVYAHTPPATTGVFLKDNRLQSLSIPEGMVTAVSQYFIVDTTVSIGQQSFVWHTLLERNMGDRAKTLILWQSRDV